MVSHVYIYRCTKQLSEQFRVTVNVLRQKLVCTICDCHGNHILRIQSCFTRRLQDGHMVSVIEVLVVIQYSVQFIRSGYIRSVVV